jgi:putative membrane protein
MRSLAIGSTLLVLSVGTAAAQIGNPAGLDPGTKAQAPGVPKRGESNATDKLFARLLSVGGMAEVNAAKLAQRKAQPAIVRAFAEQMIQDHTQASERLASLAQAANVPLPSDLDPTHKAIEARLDAATENTFSTEYMQAQVVDHQMAVQLLEWEIGSGENGDMQRFAAETLPTVLAHLQMARNVMERLTGVAGAETGSEAAPAASRAQ